MRIVLDTNVLVSGLLSPFGPPGEIVRLVTMGMFASATTHAFWASTAKCCCGPGFRSAGRRSRPCSIRSPLTETSRLRDPCPSRCRIPTTRRSWPWLSPALPVVWLPGISGTIRRICGGAWSSSRRGNFSISIARSLCVARHIPVPTSSRWSHTSAGRIPDFGHALTRPASWPSAANSSIRLIERPQEKNRVDALLANRWMRP